jgi:phosphatidylglycerophosphate synthase
VGTSAHVVSRPTHVLPGVLRVAAGDRARAASLLRAAVGCVTPAWGDDALASAVLVLVRGGLVVSASPLGPHDWRRHGIQASGAPGGPWRQRLRGASRGGDGFFSTYAVRPLSRRLTALGLAWGWRPNPVTIVSVLLGLGAAGLVATGWRWAWAVAAVVLLLALVVDCVDGEIARFTRSFSPLGAFLDAVGDRVKEYAVLGAVAAVAVREGQPGWPVAIAALGVVTLRHLEDYAYEHRLSFSRRSVADVLSVEVERDLGPEGARVTLPEPAGRRDRAVFWLKKVIHMPIAERYLLISLTLLLGRPMVVLWALTVAVSAAVLWTQGGRSAKALLRRDRTWAAVPGSPVAGPVDVQLDLGFLARAVGRLGRGPFAVGAVGALVLLVAVPWALWQHDKAVALAGAAVAVVLVGLGWQPPVHSPLGWQGPAALWVAEVLVVGIAVHHTVDVRSAAGFSFLAVVAYHRYDVIYRQRDTGQPPARWLVDAGLGTEGRMLVVLVVVLTAQAALVPVLWAGAVLLAALYVGESVVGWRSWISVRRGQVAPS